MNKTYENIVFDIGEVLIGYRWFDMLTEDGGFTPENARRIGETIFDLQEWGMMDAGLITKEELHRPLTEKLPDIVKEWKWFLEHPELMVVPRPQVWDMVRKLRERGYGIYLLSNYSEHFLNAQLADTPIRELSDGTVISYEVHLLKPNLGIYKALYKKYDLDPSTCLFFDDRKENVEGARVSGMDGVQVLSEGMLLEELQKLL